MFLTSPCQEPGPDGKDSSSYAVRDLSFGDGIVAMILGIGLLARVILVPFDLEFRYVWTIESEPDYC